MRSYYSHLQATQSIGEELQVTYKPTFRSSAIFPVLHNNNFSTRILFMGYWLIKRHILEVGLLYTLRSERGIIISRKYLLIDSAKAFSIELGEFVEEIKKHSDINNFKGSLELEIFSTKDLVFPYPAFVLTYYNEHFSTAVHTVGRIYNDIEDLKGNEEYKVKESGFDVYGKKEIEPFIAFTNGPVANEKPCVEYTIIGNNNIQSGTLRLEKLDPFQTVFLKLSEHINLKEILGETQGTITIGHNFEGFFPRFVAGNFETSKSVSITHSFYDSSELSDEKSFWNRMDESFHDSSVAVPVFIRDGFYTQIAIYPIFSPSAFTLSFEFYDINGLLLKTVNNYELIRSSDNKYELIDFGTLVARYQVNSEKVASVNLRCNWDNKSRIPTRVKFGLNIGIKGKQLSLPSNICFAPQLGNPNMLKKKGTFRWAPFLNVGDSQVIITNSAPVKEYASEAKLRLSFYREKDNTCLTREHVLPANGILILDSKKDTELNVFLSEKTGWVAVQSDNPFVNGWYFDFHSSGAVAADHVF